MEKILDLHIHSRYSRACSKDLTLPNIAAACERKGIDIVVTGDFTHPAWFNDIKNQLIEDNEGVYKLKDGNSKTRFIIGTELSSIKKHKGQTRRIHLLVFAPNVETAEKFNNRLSERGFNLKSDGRPILGLTAKEILEMMLEIDSRMIMIPAHAWTPWFGIFGSKGGYNSLEEAFDELTPHIKAIETGLSSDPLMNWRVSKLDNITLVSNSDAHSTEKLGREANVLNFENEKQITYSESMRIIQEGDKSKFLNTIEFYPEEGKYHCDGHRLCKFYCTPEETKNKYQGICPVCKKNLVVGVLNRVYELSDRTEEEAKKIYKIPFRSMVPLKEIIADTFDIGVSSKKVKNAYEKMLKNIGSEFYILLKASKEKITELENPEIADAIERVRRGNIYIRPGYDGEFGVVKVFQQSEKIKSRQLGLQMD